MIYPNILDINNFQCILMQSIFKGHCLLSTDCFIIHITFQPLRKRPILIILHICIVCLDNGLCNGYIFTLLMIISRILKLFSMGICYRFIYQFFSGSKLIRRSRNLLFFTIYQKLNVLLRKKLLRLKKLWTQFIIQILFYCFRKFILLMRTKHELFIISSLVLKRVTNITVST